MAVSEHLGNVPGLTWRQNGQSVLSGPLLDLADRLDRYFVSVASEWNAAEYRFPLYIAAGDLAPIDYLRSFPQLVSFPISMKDDDANLAGFTGGVVTDGEGVVPLAETAPVKDVVTPAACYHFYINFAGSTFDEPRYVTTRATCCRREREYHPLERQWSFSMREIVCLGTADEAEEFLESAVSKLTDFGKRLGLSLDWITATDPFFRPPSNPQYIMQLVDPSKRELTFDGRLAIGSANLHHDHFGRAYRINAARNGVAEPVHTACIAFGVERWLAAIIQTFGSDPGGWPEIPA